MKLSGLFAVCATTLALAACHPVDSAWERASAADTVESYSSFVNRYPTDSRVKEARHRIEVMTDPADWQLAQDANTIKSYRDYVAYHIEGKHFDEALRRIATLERKAALSEAETAGTPEALRRFLDKYQEGRDAEQARAMLVELEKKYAENADYRIELGKYARREEADDALSKVLKEYGSALGPVLVVALPAPDAPFALRSTAMTQQDARVACAKVKKHNQPCSVIKR